MTIDQTPTYSRRTPILTPTASEKCLNREHGGCKGRAWDLPRLLPTNCKCPCHVG